MKYRYRTVDVFAETPFLGNPVAVIEADESLDTDTMLRITRWMNLSETTFLLPPDRAGADYRVRIFTLDRELPFAGHPTLGSCAAWLDLSGDPARSGHVVQQCEAGLIPVRRIDGRHAFAAPPLLRDGKPDDDTIEEVCRFLDIRRARIQAIEWIDNGPGWLGVRLASADEVLAVQPASRHPQRIEVGLIGPCPAGSDCDFEVRALFSDPHGAIREDPVTGSLNAAFAQWLLASGQARAPYVAGQGQKLGRRGRVYVSEEDDELWIAGATHILVRGELALPP